MKTMLLVFVSLLWLAGCGSGSSSSSNNSTSGGGAIDLTTKFQEVNPKVLAASAAKFDLARMLTGGAMLMDVAAPIPISALYFGEIEVTSYMYNPSGTVQMTNPAGGYNSSVWSSWVSLQSGHPKARNNLLKFGDQLDISALNGGYKSVPTEAFIREAKRFRIDLIEVYLYRTGVIYNNVFYGMEAGETVNVGTGNDVIPKDILYKNPEYAGIREIQAVPKFPGVDRGQNAVQDASYILARDDWFSQPVVILMDQYQRGVIESSSIPLTPQQQDIVQSFVREGSTRRFYDNLVIIPFHGATGPLVVNFPQRQGEPEKTVGKNQVQDLTAWADNIQLQVEFDLSDALLNPLDWTQNQTDLAYKGDAQNVPFGINVSISKKH